MSRYGYEFDCKANREHYQKYEAMTKQIGVERLVQIIRHHWTPEHIRAGLDRGDEHLNKTMPLRVIDAITGYASTPPGFESYYTAVPPLRSPFKAPMSHGEACCCLKHVATYDVAGRPRPVYALVKTT